MGNTCYCNSSQQEHDLAQMEAGGDETPRLMLKPEKLPHLTHAVKSQSKKLIGERENEVPADSRINKIVAKVEAKPTILIQSQQVGENNNMNNANNLLNNIENKASNNNVQQQPYMMKSVEKQLKQEEVKEPPKPLTLFDKLGGEEGVQTFTEKVLNKAIADPLIGPYFKNHNMSLLKEKFRYYVGYLAGGHQFWIGQSMQDAHKNILISDQIFDSFISLCVQSLKEMRVKHDCLKETTRTLQQLRDNLVKKPEELQPKTFFEELGGMDQIKLICEATMKQVLVCPKIGPYFQYSDISLHEKRLAYYFAYATGGQKEWLGRSIVQAHKGKLISSENFDLFTKYLINALNECKVPKSHQDKLIELVKGIKQDIAEDTSQLTLFEKLDSNNRFEPVMSTFIDKMMKDKYLSVYFTNNKMKHCISNKIVLFFAYTKGIMSTDDMKTLGEYHRQIKMNSFDFERSIILFKDTLYENNIDAALVEETLNFYKTMRKDLVHDPEEVKIPHDHMHNTYQHQRDQNQASGNNNNLGCPFTQHQLQQNMKEDQKKDSEKVISSFKIESGSQLHDSSNIVSIQKEVERINKQIEEEAKQQELELEKQNQEQKLKEQEQQQEEAMQVENHEEPIVIEPVEEDEHLLKDEEEVIKQVDEQILQYEQSQHDIKQQISPFKSKRNQQYRYLFSELLSEGIQFEGQLQRNMDKQKTQLPRWLILRQSSLFIYKDQMSSKSFPQKPLYCLPLQEIKSINASESLAHPNQRKSQAIHILEIELKECYGTIASFVAQLLTGNTVFMGVGPHQPQQGFNNKGGNIKSQTHSYNDTILTFVSSSKKEIFNWVKKLKALVHEEERIQEFKETIENKPEAIDHQPTIFERVGGADSINALVEGMYGKIFNDPELTDFFKKTNQEHQKEMQKKFLTYATGGPSEWTGKSMLDSHKGRGIGYKEFDKVAEHVVSTLNELSVPQDLINEIVQLLLTLKEEISGDYEKDKNLDLQEPSSTTLYARIGGAQAIEALVEGMYSKIFNDSELKEFFKKTNQDHQKDMQKRFLTYLTGGTKEWIGKTMFEAHQGRGINSYEFDKVALHIVKTLQELNVQQPLINEIVSHLLPIKKQIAEDLQIVEPQKIVLKPSLFDRLGGAEAINFLVEEMYSKIFSDHELSHFFKKTNKDHQKEMQKQFLTFVTSGSKEWNSKTMQEAHKGRGIGSEVFDKFTSHIVSTLQDLKVNQDLIDELIELLNPMKSDVADSS